MQVECSSLTGVSPERFSLSSVSNMKVIKGKLSDTTVPFLSLVQLPLSGVTTYLTKLRSCCTCNIGCPTLHEGKMIILWNQKLKTDRNILNNKPHNINRKNEKENCLSIDISGDINVTKKEAEEILK